MSNGGSQILDYSVFFDQGLQSWTLVASNIQSRQYVVPGLTIGVRYTFYVRSRNVFGQSSNSATVTILAAAAPLAPPAPTTVAVND